jgi:uncharacterized SAM-binding protein YcdF (DUF218 family)
MDLILNALKGQFNTLNFFLLLLIAGFLFLKFNCQKRAKLCWLMAFLFLTITSTGYLPGYLTKNVESSYSVFGFALLPNRGDTVFIHVLGGGYTLDKRLPANSQLSWTSLGRLTEAMRIARHYENSILVVSGNIASGDNTLAQVGKQAAINLGFDSTRIATLNEPATTQAEAEAFVKQFGKQAKLILVTDAIHLPRAMKIFKSLGVDPIPAPANFLIKIDNNPINMMWMPSIDNMQLMDRIFREWLGSLKGYVMDDIQ